MPRHQEDVTPRSKSRWIGSSLAAQLTLLLAGAMVATFLCLGYLTLRHHRQNLETATLTSAERFSDLIERSTSYCMLRNDREGLYHIIDTIADEPGVVRIRVFNEEGRISLSTDPHEEATFVDKQAEACYGCHASEQPLVHLERPDRFRIYRKAGGDRSLGIINPIENREACWSAPCHAHPPDQKILGVLDTSLSLAQADEALAAGSAEMIGYLLIAMAAISILSGIFVWRMVHRPVRGLKIGTMRLARGDLGYQIDLHRHDELGDLAGSFNHMSRQLHEAQEQLTDWARTLESRVETKSRELRLAHDHVVQVEKMASLGKLSATVAHEINNPLSGILTYAKLLKKWISRAVESGEEKNEMLHSLELIESESRRCGELVKNLLMFARAAPMNMGWTKPSTIVERCLRLIKHRIELAGIQLHRELDAKEMLVYCDRAQMEQVLLALLVNALEAMPRGGNLTVRTRVQKTGRAIEIQVQDDGAGIPPEVLPKMFEPFFTTKEGAQEVGLGLAVSRGIVQRHGGEITAESDAGRGTTFTVTLPVDHGRTEPAPTEGGEAAA